MKPNNPHFSLTACALATVVLMSACGGGGAGAPPTEVGSSGFAINGYLSGANVLCDVNGNHQLDAGEASATTDPDGFFKLATLCSSTLMASGGINTNTQQAFNGRLKAPVGSTMITALTTLLAEGLPMERVATVLNLAGTTDLRNTDPARRVGGVYENADLYRKTQVIQLLIQRLAEAAMSSGGGGLPMPQLYGEVAASLAVALRDGGALIDGGQVSSAAVAAAIEKTLTRSASAVGLSGINPATLAQVVSPALHAALQQLLTADDASMASLTATLQLDARWGSFLATHRARLAAAPGDDSSALASELLALLNESTAPPSEPPPPDEGVTLLSFDEATPVFIDMGAYGGALPDVQAGPTGGSGNALRILKPAGQEPWGGVYFGLPRIPFTAEMRTITARVYSTRANAVIRFKVEAAGGLATEVASAPVPANTWTTVSWNMSGVELGSAYRIVAITPDVDTTTSGQIYYIDNITLVKGGSQSAPAPGPIAPPAPAPTPPSPPPPAPPPPPSAEPSCATSTLQCLGFAESTIGVVGFEGLLDAMVVDDPVSGSANRVLRLIKGTAGQPWAGATPYTMSAPGGPNGTVLTINQVGLTSSKLVTVRSYSGAPVGTIITLKLENGLDPSQNIAAEAVTTKVNQWEVLTFNFDVPSTGVFSSNTVYNTASIFPAFSIPGGTLLIDRDTTFYFDELKYAVAGSSAPPPPPPPAPPPPAPPSAPLVFSTGFSGANRTVEGGEFGGFSGSNLDGFNCNGLPENCGGGGEGPPAIAAADSYYYYYYQTPTPATALYAGIYIQAPGVTGGFGPQTDIPGVRINGQTTMKFNFNQNPEWYQTSTNNFMVQFDLGKFYPGGCRIQLRKVVTPTAAAMTSYTVNLSEFAVVQDCAQAGMTTALALAGSPISQVSFQAAGGGSAVSDGQKTTGANLSVQAGNVYPTTLVLKGAITFE